MDRIDFLQYLINKFNYENYLEIGCSFDECFSKINIKNKVGVDPIRGGTHRMISDDFFKQNISKFDLIFIDGLHHCEQSYQDVLNSLNILNDNGTIVIHDCRPEIELDQNVPYSGQNIWTGDVWKSFVMLRARNDIDMAVGDFDYGCGVIRVRENRKPLKTNKDMFTLSWKDYVKNKEIYLNLLSYDKLIDWI